MLTLLFSLLFASPADAHQIWTTGDTVTEEKECGRRERFVTFTLAPEAEMPATVIVTERGLRYRYQVTPEEPTVSFCVRPTEQNPYFLYEVHMQNDCNNVGDYNLGAISYRLTLNLQGALCRPVPHGATQRDDYWNGYEGDTAMLIPGYVGSIWLKPVGTLVVEPDRRRKTR